LRSNRHRAVATLKDRASLVEESGPHKPRKLKGVAEVHRSAGRKQQRVAPVDVANETEVKAGAAGRADRIRSRVVDLAADRDLRRDFAGQRRAAVPPISIARARIYVQSATAEQRPWARTFLRPYR